MNRRILLGFIFSGILVTLFSCKREPTFSRSSLPIGSVDLPAPKSTVRGPIQVAGWALAEQPIREVSVYIDGKYLTSASTKMPRPDVVLARPDYKDARNCGFTLTVDTSTLAGGWHEVVVQARAEDGATRDLGTVPVLVQP
jgi:N-acetylmuramoyl-L-alanine amidase